MIGQFFTAYNLRLWFFESKDEINWVFQPDCDFSVYCSWKTVL